MTWMICREQGSSKAGVPRAKTFRPKATLTPMAVKSTRCGLPATNRTSPVIVVLRWRPWSAAEEELWAVGLAWEGLRRLATTLELARRADTAPGPAAATRMTAVEAINVLLPG